MSNIDSEHYPETATPIPQTENAPEVVMQDATSTTDEKQVEAAQQAEEPAAPISQIESAPEAVVEETASTSAEEQVEAAQQLD